MTEQMMKAEKKESDKGASSDRQFWYVWMGLMLIAVVLLPFIVREGALVRAIADMCITALGG
ncbi:MAG: hypothetical protein ACPHAP_04615 [Candidatus Puniceispirillaceae bacterium]